LTAKKIGADPFAGPHARMAVANLPRGRFSCDLLRLCARGATVAKAKWNGAVIAESDTFEIVEGNVYFPVAAVKRELLRPSEKHTVCGWKGTASYYDVVVDGKRNADAAWFYDDPKPAAENIRGHVAFWRGVTVER
jgi:uncharacterized protein (DUF427 family)